MRQGNRYKFVIGAAALLAIVLSVVFSLKSEQWELTVGDDRISEEEYLETMKSVEYDTRVQLQSEYKVSYGEDFWEKQYGVDGRYGYELLAENTLKQLKYIHAVYDLAVENDYLSDGSYEMRVQRLEAENERRREMLDRGEVIYGLKEYPADLFLQYELSAIKEKYCNGDMREGMKLSEEEIVAHYNSRKWIFGEEEIVADLEMARVAVVRELRELKYDEIIARRGEELKVTGEGKDLNRFTREHCKD